MTDSRSLMPSAVANSAFGRQGPVTNGRARMDGTRVYTALPAWIADPTWTACILNLSDSTGFPPNTVDGGPLGGAANPPYLRYVEYGAQRLAAENPGVTVMYDLWDGGNNRLAYEAPRILSAGGVPVAGGLPRATLPGSSGAILVWPQLPSNRITGLKHVWFEFLIDPDPANGWRPPVQQNIFSLATTAAGGTGMLIALQPNGSLIFRFSPDGTRPVTRTSALVPGTANTRGTGVRIGIDVVLDTGNTTQQITWFTNSNPLGGSLTWKRFGPVVTTAGSTSIYSPPAATWAIGSGAGIGATANNFKGDVYEFRLRSGDMDGPDLLPVSPEQWYWGKVGNPGLDFGPINGSPLLRIVNAAWPGRGLDEFDSPEFLPKMVPRRPYLASTINTGHNDAFYFGERLQAKADRMLERLTALTGHVDTAVLVQNITQRTDGRGYPASRQKGGSARGAQFAQWATSRGLGVIDTRKVFLDYLAGCAADPSLIHGNRPPGTYPDGSQRRNGTIADLIDTRSSQAGVHPFDLGAQLQADHWVDELTAA